MEAKNRDQSGNIEAIIIAQNHVTSQPNIECKIKRIEATFRVIVFGTKTKTCGLGFQQNHVHLLLDVY